MFETAEIGQKVSKKVFDQIAPALRLDLVELQQQLRGASFPLIVVFAGVDGAGKGETVNLVNEWMDPRWIVTRAYSKPSDDERERPEFWRYWRDLPARGQVGLFLSSWYSTPVLERVYRRGGKAKFDRRLDRIVAFERTLADDGALILKFWMHLGHGAQEKRLRQLERDPLQSWRVSQQDWQHWRQYDRFVAAAEHAIRRTSTGLAPWTIVEGVDARYRTLTVLTGIRDAVRRRLAIVASATRAAEPRGPSARQDAPPTESDPAPHVAVPQRTILQALDMKQTLTRPLYSAELKQQRARLNRAHRQARDRGLSIVLVFEGWDASGKGGAVRRLTAALDARHVQVIPIAAPSDEERSHHYLWRFWRHLARAGRVTVFDRSWYGRVLVERVEGFANEVEWRRAYAEINDFEDQLVEHGIVLVKFWMHISAKEQLRRFEARSETPYKRWKLTDEDWRNREKWPLYDAAVDEMVQQTSTRAAPWTLVEANDKRYARVKVISTVCDCLESALDSRLQRIDPDAEHPDPSSA